MTPPAGPLDPGLQPERTVLAWRRTALALTVGPLVAARLLVPEHPVASWLAALAGLVVGGAVAAAARARHRATHQALTQEADRGQLPGGALLLLTAAVPAVVGVLGLAALLARP